MAPLFPDSPSDELAVVKARLAQVEKELAECQEDYDELETDFTAYMEHVEGHSADEDEDEEEETSTSSPVPHQVELLQNLLAKKEEELAALQARVPLKVEIVKESPRAFAVIVALLVVAVLTYYNDEVLHLSRVDSFYEWGCGAFVLYIFNSLRRS